MIPAPDEAWPDRTLVNGTLVYKGILASFRDRNHASGLGLSLHVQHECPGYMLEPEPFRDNRCVTLSHASGRLRKMVWPGPGLGPADGPRCLPPSVRCLGWSLEQGLALSPRSACCFGSVSASLARAWLLVGVYCHAFCPDEENELLKVL